LLGTSAERNEGGKEECGMDGPVIKEAKVKAGVAASLRQRNQRSWKRFKEERNRRGEQQKQKISGFGG